MHLSMVCPIAKLVIGIAIKGSYFLDSPAGFVCAFRPARGGPAVCSSRTAGLMRLHALKAVCLCQNLARITKIVLKICPQRGCGIRNCHQQRSAGPLRQAVAVSVVLRRGGFGPRALRRGAGGSAAPYRPCGHSGEFQAQGAEEAFPLLVARLRLAYGSAINELTMKDKPHRIPHEDTLLPRVHVKTKGGIALKALSMLQSTALLSTSTA